MAVYDPNATSISNGTNLTLEVYRDDLGISKARTSFLALKNVVYDIFIPLLSNSFKAILRRGHF